MTPEGDEILIVEDSLTQALKLQHLLKQHDYAVVVARSGGAALAALEKRPPALVLSQIVLPDMDGYQLCRRIKAAERFRDVSVILLSALSDPTDVLRMLDCGADDFIAKPYEESALLARLRQIRVNRDLRGQSAGEDIEIFFAGARHRLAVPDGARALGLLLSAYELAVHREGERFPAGEAPEPGAEEHPEAGSERRLRVLLAEDSAVNQRLAVHVLEKQGHAVVAVGNGREALTALEKQTFDLILMDVEMPEMDGFEATAAVREREQKQGGHLPIIAMTAHSDEESRVRCRVVGMDGYVSKPLRAQDLLAALEGLARNPAPDTPVLDPSEALKRVGDDRDLLREIVGLFFQETPALLAEIQTAIALRDAKMLERAAHSLKGSVAAFGAHPACEAAQNLEDRGRRGEFADVETARSALEAEIARLQPALAALQNEAAN